jgi:DNA-binding IclR family transcriptional regulator
MVVQSVDRALRILEIVGDRPGGLADVSARSSLPLTTTSRLLDTLQHRGAVVRDAAGTYTVGPFLKHLGNSGTAAATIESSGAEVVAALADELDEAACISIPIGSQTLTIMQIAVQKPVQAQDWTGHRWSITGGGSGAVMMATWPAGRVDALLANLASAERTAVRDEIAKARRSGVSWSHGTYVEGLSSVAAPILGPDGTAVAAVLGYGPTYRFPGKGQVRGISAAVAAAGATISRNLES